MYKQKGGERMDIKKAAKATKTINEIKKAIMEYDQTLMYKTPEASANYGGGRMYRFDNSISCNAHNLAFAIYQQIENKSRA
jgi:hypothetical protein